MFEPGTITEPHWIVGPKQGFDGVGDGCRRQPVRQSAFERNRGETDLARIVIAKYIDRERGVTCEFGREGERSRRMADDDHSRPVRHRARPYVRHWLVFVVAVPRGELRSAQR